MIRKIIFSFGLTAAMLWPGVALMQGSTIPAFNPLCWHKDDCAAVRQQVAGTEESGDCERDGAMVLGRVATIEEAATGWARMKISCKHRTFSMVPAAARYRNGDTNRPGRVPILSTVLTCSAVNC